MFNTEKSTQATKIESRKIVIMGLFIALSFIGSLIKIPSAIGTVAFDSAPAFISAILLGPIPGATVGFMGHILTSMNVGFPLTIPVHLLIGTEMALICAIVGVLYKKRGIIIALCMGLVLNGIGAPASLIAIPSFGVSFFLVMVVPLLIGSSINLIIAYVIVRYLKRGF